MSTLSPFREDVEVASPAPQSGETWMPRRRSDSVRAGGGGRGRRPRSAEADEFDFGAAEGELSHPLLSLFPVPAAVLEALSGGLSSLAVSLAAGAGFRDVNQLTNIVFYFRHPDRIGTKIRPDERALAGEWIDIRDRIVKPALALTAARVRAGAAADRNADDAVVEHARLARRVRRQARVHASRLRRPRRALEGEGGAATSGTCRPASSPRSRGVRRRRTRRRPCASSCARRVPS